MFGWGSGNIKITMFLQKKTDPRYRRLHYVGLALFVALAYDWFLWDKTLGLGFFIFVTVYLALFVGLTAITKEKKQLYALLLVGPIMVLSATTIFYRNEFVVYAVPVIVLILSFLFSIFYTLNNPHGNTFSFTGIPILRSIDLPLIKWAQVYRDLFRWNKDINKDIVRRVLIGVAISVPILIFFGFLLAEADEVFAQWVRTVINIDLVDVWRLFRTFAITLLLSGVLYVFVDGGNELGKKTPFSELPDTVIVSIVLFFVNILFAVFVYFQFRYLFGGSDFVLENGLIYSEYARKGFFQLCWVVGLAALMLLFVYRSFTSHHKFHIVRILQTVLIAQVVVVAFSALKRMDLYQSIFGFTVLRLYVEWFMYFVVVILFFTVLSMLLGISFRIFLYSSFVIGVLALVVISLLNIDLLIARENVRRFVEEKKDLDMKYLNLLSSDIVPAVEPLFKAGVYESLDFDQKNYLSLIIKKSKTENVVRDSWQEFHLGNYKSNNFIDNSDMKKYAN